MKGLAYCRHRTEENYLLRRYGSCVSCWLMSLWMLLMMKSRLQRHFFRWSTIETARDGHFLATLSALLLSLLEGKTDCPISGVFRAGKTRAAAAIIALHSGRKKATDARFETMIGRSSWVDSLFVWFPAAWMPLVIDALREKSCMYTQSAARCCLY